MEHRLDRFIEINAELSNMGLEGEQFNAVTHSLGYVGCSSSHLELLKLAKSRNYKNILILEDDFEFLVSKDELEKELSQFFDSKIEYDVCMLAYLLIESHNINEYPFIKRVISAQTSAGYLVNEKYYDKLIKLYEWANPILEQSQHHWIWAYDQIWKQLQQTDKWVCFTKRIGKQRDGFSDISNGYVNYNC